MDSRTFYATALKSGSRLQTCISDTAVKALSIVPGDEVEIVIRKTGRTGRRNANAFKKKAMVNPAESAKEPVTMEAPAVVPAEIIKQVYHAKKKGMSPESIKESFNTTTDYKWEDLPEAVRKDIEEG